MFRIGPYTLPEALRWFYRYLFGPTRRHALLTTSLPQVWNPNSIKPRLTLTFTGDLMSNQDKALRFEDELRNFVAGSDHLIVNLEGVLSDETDRPLVKQHSSARVLDDLSALHPLDGIVFSLGNNHAADFGPEKLRATVEDITDRGARVIGTAAEPGLRLAEKVYIHGATHFSNQPSDQVAYLADARTDPNCDVNILCPHWGEEFVVYPGPEQIARGRELLSNWDMLVGHHSHCPGPVAAYPMGGRERWIAYSLGNLAVFFDSRAVRWGVLLKLTLGPAEDGRWQIGRLEWRYTCLRRVNSREIIVGIEETCPVM